MTAPVDRPGLRTRLLGWAWAWFLRLLCMSWLKRAEGFEAIDVARAQGQKFLLCFWHGKYLPVMGLCRWLWIEQRRESACVFTSLSGRGAVIAEICRNFGLDCILIPDGGHRNSYELMRSALAVHTAGVIAVDGPLGPDRQVKQGAVRLASELGYRLVPAGIYSARKWVIASRWDRMEIPYPLTRIGLSMGKPVNVPENLSRQQIREAAEALAENLGVLEQKARALVGRRQS